MTRRRAQAALVLLVLAATAGCGGEEESSFTGEAEFLHAAGGVNTRVGEVLLRDISLDEPADTEYEAGDIARLRVTLVNQAEQPDALLGVGSPATDDTAILVDPDCDGTFESSGEVLLPPTPLLRTPAPGVPDGPTSTHVVGVRLDESVQSGSTIPVTFVFRSAGATTVQVPVELTDQPLMQDGDSCRPA